MIIDIEQLEGKLVISTIGESGDVEFVNINIPEDQQYYWEYCNDSSRAHPTIKSWNEKPVRKHKTRFLNKWRIEEFLMSQSEAIKKKLYTLYQPKMFFVDIEVEVTDDGFPKPELARNAITAIAFSHGNRVHGMGTRKLTADQITEIENKINSHFSGYSKIEFNYIFFETEYDMLYSFLSKAIHRMPVVTGWNFMGFDWPYIYNRAVNIGIDPAIASPCLKIVGKNNLPMHRIVIDYLSIYKKWDRKIEIKENNSLDFVSKAVLGLQKIKYSGTLQDLYEQNYQEYIFYNAVDTRLVQLIHEKLLTVQTFFTLANITGVEVQKTFSPIWMTEAVIAREFYGRNRVFPKSMGDNRKGQSYEGAYVFKPIPGLYLAVGSFDFASLYPSIMRQWNISPESYVKNTTEEVDQALYIKTASGAVFRKDRDSVFRTVLTDFYGRRKKAKKIMQELEMEIDYLKTFVQ